MLRKSFASLISIAFGLAALVPAALADGDVEVRSRVITDFKIGSDETKFGTLEFLGGLDSHRGQHRIPGVGVLQCAAPQEQDLS